MNSCPVCSKQFNSPESLAEHLKSVHPTYQQSTSKTGKYLFYLIGAAVLVLIIYFVFFSASSQYDAFAQCLTDRGATFYGAWWCPHCKEQKDLFGSSTRYLNYVECSAPDGNTQYPVCSNLGIQGYPTWIFSDGSRGDQMTLEELSQRTGCPLP